MYFRLTWQENDCWEKTECTLNPTAYFPSVYIAGNTLGKSALKDLFDQIGLWTDQDKYNIL
jgi:hypothetical protein